MVMLLFAFGCGDDSSVAPMLTPTSLPTPTPGGNVSTLTVNVLPADAVATVTVDLAEEEARVLQESAQGEFILYLAAGTYNVTISATGYNSVSRTVTLGENEERIETVDLSGGELPLEGLSIEPRVCINTGLVPFKISVNNFIGTGTAALMNGDTVIAEDTLEDNGDGSYSCEFTIGNTISAGEYAIRVTHNPPVIETSSTTASAALYVEDTIQDAIDRANSLYTEEGGANQIKTYIPEGIYTEGTGIFPALPVILKSGVYLYGAEKNSVIDGENTARATSLFTTEYMLQNFTMEGFTVTGAYNTGSDGGVFNLENGVFNGLIQNNTFSGNKVELASDGYGGVFYFNSEPPSLAIKNNVFTNNSSSLQGGAIYVRTYLNCQLDIEENTFTGNSITHDNGQGGAICISSGEGVYNILNNTISNNTVSGNNSQGGALYIELTNDAECLVENNTITGNKSLTGSSSGGAIYALLVNMSGVNTLKITGNTIDNNETSSVISFGGGICIYDVDPGDTVEITGNNIRNNVSASGDGGGIFINDWQEGFIRENNIYGNTAFNSTGREITSYAGSTVDATNNWWWEGTTPGTVGDKVSGTITTDPVASGPFDI